MSCMCNTTHTWHAAYINTGTRSTFSFFDVDVYRVHVVYVSHHLPFCHSTLTSPEVNLVHKGTFDIDKTVVNRCTLSSLSLPSHTWHVQRSTVFFGIFFWLKWWSGTGWSCFLLTTIFFSQRIYCRNKITNTQHNGQDTSAQRLHFFFVHGRWLPNV